MRDPKDRDNDSTPLLLSSLKTPNAVDKVRQKVVDQEQKVEANDKKHTEVITPHSAIKMPMTSKVRFGDVSSGPITSAGIEEVVRARLKKKNDSDRKVGIRNVKKKESASEQQQEVEKKKKCGTPKKALAIFEDDDIVKDEKPKGKLKEKEEIKKTAEKKEESPEKVKKLKEVEIFVENPDTNEIVKKKSLKETEESEDEKVKPETSSKKVKAKNDGRTEDKMPMANTRKEKKKKENKEQLSGSETEEEEEVEGEEGKKGDNDRKDKKQKNKQKKKKKTEEKNEEAVEGGKKKREKKRKEKVGTDEDEEIDEEEGKEERESGKKVKKAIKLKKANVASADEDEKGVTSRKTGAEKKRMKRGDEAEDQNESSNKAVYEKYTDSDGENRLRRVPIVTERRIKRKPKKNKQRMADASQYNRYNDDEEEMDEVQETAPAKQRKAPKQQQQSQITRQGRTLQGEQFLEDTAPINLTMPDRINQLQSPRHQHRYKELRSRIGNIEDDYDDPNLTTKESRDIANRRLRMLLNQRATEKETEELQRLMAEGSQRNVEHLADEVTRERKSLRETIRGKSAKTMEAKREDLQTDGPNTRLSTEDEEVALEDNVGTTAEVRQPTKPQRKRTLQSQDAMVLEPTSTNADDHKTYVSPSTVATEELWAGDSQEKPKEREIDPRLNLMASRRPSQIADPRRKWSINEKKYKAC